MARTTNRITKGTGVYACRCCGRKTRDTGRGDNELANLCEECFDLAGEENHFSDNGTLYSSHEEVRRLYDSIQKKGGDNSKFNEFMAAIKRAPQESIEAPQRDMRKVSGVWLKPQVVADEEQAAEVALDGLRRRGILARNDKGELVVCSRKTARKYGWKVEGDFNASPAREPKAKKAKAPSKEQVRKERLEKLNEATTAKDQWSKIAAKAAKGGAKSKEAATKLKKALGLEEILG